MQAVTLTVHRISPNSSWYMAVYMQDFKACEISCVPHRRRLHAGKDQRQSFIFNLSFSFGVPQTHHLAACTFPVAIYWFIHTCRMLTGHAACLRCSQWAPSFTEFPRQRVALRAAVVQSVFQCSVCRWQPPCGLWLTVPRRAAGSATAVPSPCSARRWSCAAATRTCAPGLSGSSGTWQRSSAPLPASAPSKEAGSGTKLVRFTLNSF